MAWHITFYACLHKRTGNSFAILENRSILTRDACKMIFFKLTLRLFSPSLWPVVLCCLLKHIEQDPDVLWYFDGCFMVAQRAAWCDLSWARDTACEQEEEEAENDDQIWTQIIIEYLSRVVFFCCWSLDGQTNSLVVYIYDWETKLILSQLPSLVKVSLSLFWSSCGAIASAKQTRN